MNTLEEYKKRFSVVDLNRYVWMRRYAPKGVKMIDIGCCYGRAFEDYDHSKVTSVDIDDYSHVVKNFVRADARKLPFADNSFDVAVITEILEHQPTLEDSRKVLSEAVRVANRVILSVPNEYLWADTTEKFKSYEKELQENNYDITNKAKFTAKYAKEIYKDDDYKHLFHHHHFSPYEIEELIKSVTDKDYTIFIFPNDGDPEQGAVGTTGAIIE